MVRINLIHPKKLADQHLVAEYTEILMLLGHVRKFPHLKDIPKEYTLGKGHIKFFKDKLKYLKKRHELIKKEMKKRGFVPKKTIDLKDFAEHLLGDWSPSFDDINKIKKRLKEKIELKPTFYKYHRKNKKKEFFLNLLK